VLVAHGSLPEHLNEVPRERQGLVNQHERQPSAKSPEFHNVVLRGVEGLVDLA
jgi:hypothetical protein